MDRLKGYGALGLRVDSEIELPLAAPAATDSERVLVRLGHAAVAPDPPGELVAQLGESGQGYEVWRSTGRYFARFGAKGALAIDPVERIIHVSEDSPLLAHIAANLGLALYLVAQGECVLHAAAFVVEGQAHAIVGGSRSGKTTLTALMVANGARMVSDDTLRVVFAEEVRCAGASAALRLRPSAASLAELMNAGPTTVSADGRHVVRQVDPARGQEPLASVWFVRIEEGLPAAKLAEVSRTVAFQRLVDGLRVRGLRERVLAQRQLEHIATLARRLPVFEARVPLGPPFRREWGEQLLADFLRR